MRSGQHRQRLRRLQQEAERRRFHEESTAADGRDRIPVTVMQLAGLKPATDGDWRRLDEWMQRRGFGGDG